MFVQKSACTHHELATWCLSSTFHRSTLVVGNQWGRLRWVQQHFCRDVLRWNAELRVSFLNGSTRKLLKRVRMQARESCWKGSECKFSGRESCNLTTHNLPIDHKILVHALQCWSGCKKKHPENDGNLCKESSWWFLLVGLVSFFAECLRCVQQQYLYILPEPKQVLFQFQRELPAFWSSANCTSPTNWLPLFSRYRTNYSDAARMKLNVSSISISI